MDVIKMTLLYIDTNVIIDAVEGRKNKFGKPIGNHAADLFGESIKCKLNLIISTWALEELAGLGKFDSTKMFFGLVKKKVKTVKHSLEEKEQAKVRSKDCYDDALHIIIAEREHTDFIVTRNIDDFMPIGSKIKIVRPENLI
jgi:predicted nucleic acid-binding protein